MNQKSSAFRRLQVLAFSLFISAFIYLPSLNHGFVDWDDNNLIRSNDLLRTFDLPRIFTDLSLKSYYPLSVLAYSIQYHLFGLNSVAFHSVSLIFHLANTWLVYLLLVRLFPSSLISALLTTLLFGVHALHVESVAWASEQRDVISTFFCLLSLLAYLNYIKIQKDRRSRFYAVGWLLFLFAALTKSMVVTLPIILFLTDFLENRKWNPKLILEKLPFFAVSFGVGLIELKAQAPNRPEILASNFIEKLSLIYSSLIFYLSKALIPTHLSVFYEQGLANTTLWDGLAAGAVVAAIIWLLTQKELRRQTVFGLAFFLISLSLVLKVTPFGSPSYVNDRYMYLPSVGLFWVFGVFLSKIYEISAKRGALYKKAFLCLVGGFFVSKWGRLPKNAGLERY